MKEKGNGVFLELIDYSSVPFMKLWGFSRLHKSGVRKTLK